jgi:hypothetical protein
MMVRGRLATAAAVEKQVGLGAQQQLGATRRHRTQDRPVASPRVLVRGHGAPTALSADRRARTWIQAQST